MFLEIKSSPVSRHEISSSPKKANKKTTIDVVNKFVKKQKGPDESGLAFNLASLANYKQQVKDRSKFFIHCHI